MGLFFVFENNGGDEPMAEKKTTAKKTTKKTTKPTTKKDKVFKPEVVEMPTKSLINPLMNPNTMITPTQEVEEKLTLMQDIDSITTLNKQLLAAKREKTQLQIQNRALDEANRTMDAMVQIMDVLLDESVMNKVKSNIETARDVKELAVAYGIMADKLKELQGDNVLEDMGSKKRMKISVAFQNDSGEKAGVQVEV